MELTKTLTKLGLSEKAANVYLVGVELNMASVQALAIKTKIKRTTIYSVLEELKTFNLVQETIKGKKRYFSFAHPNQLKVIQNDRESVLEQSWDALQKLAAESPGKPNITHADSLTEIQKLYDTAVRSVEIDTIGISGSAIASKIDSDWLADYIEKRNRRGVKARTMLTDSPQARKWKAKDPNDNRELRLLAAQCQLPINIEVVGNTTIITSLQGEQLGLAIESSKISTGMREILNIVWESTQD